MTRETALGLLAQGNTGSELLTILDVIFADVNAQEVVTEAEWFKSLSIKEGHTVSPFFIIHERMAVVKVKIREMDSVLCALNVIDRAALPDA